jgi:hypothetical protein
MTPAAYVELYHDLVFDDPRTGQRTADAEAEASAPIDEAGDR